MTAPRDDKLPGDAYAEHLRARFWLVNPQTGEYVGKGRVALLEAIARTGSIRQAAKEMGMSYKRAWTLVRALNALGAQPMVETEAGGRSGGGARLTPFGERTLAVYHGLQQELARQAQQLEERWLTHWLNEDAQHD